MDSRYNQMLWIVLLHSNSVFFVLHFLNARKGIWLSVENLFHSRQDSISLYQMLFCKLKFWNWNLKTSFAAAGLHLPQMLFWNCIKKRNKVQEIRETLFFVHSFDCAPMHLRIRWINNRTLCTAQSIIKRLQISWELLTMQILWSNQLLTSRQKSYKQVSDQA